MLRYIHDVFLRGGRGALSVNGGEMTVVNSKTGEQLYHNSFITNHQLTEESVPQVAQAGRWRWKIANENNNVRTTKGYHIEHNFGHGKQYLSAFLLSLNLLAFLSHTVLGWCDDKYALLRQTLVRHQTFFEDIRALTRYMVFETPWPASPSGTGWRQFSARTLTSRPHWSAFSTPPCSRTAGAKQLASQASDVKKTRCSLATFPPPARDDATRPTRVMFAHEACTPQHSIAEGSQ
jgi:hypothetical protein